MKQVPVAGRAEADRVVVGLRRWEALEPGDEGCALLREAVRLPEPIANLLNLVVRFLATLPKLIATGGAPVGQVIEPLEALTVAMLLFP
jgi:hypothetical protein